MESVELGRTLGDISELTHLVPIRPGFLSERQYSAPVGRKLTYRLRLEQLLSGLSELERRHFPTPVRRLGVIHAARWAIVDIGGGAVQKPHLLFATHYDGSWHDYIKQFSTDVWPLMDMIWSNCVGYRGAKKFAALSAFVEKYQVKADALYVDNPQLSVGQARRLEQQRRSELKQPPRSMRPSASEVALAEALFRKLRDVYPTKLYERAKRLLLPTLPAPAPTVRASPTKLADVQPHVVEPLDVDCALLVSVHFPDQAAARDVLARALRRQTESSDLDIGLSHGGLELLGVGGGDLVQLSEAFRGGMRSRAALLGDEPSDYPEQAVPPHALLALFARTSDLPADDARLRAALASDFEHPGRGTHRLRKALAPVRTTLEQTVGLLLEGLHVRVVDQQLLHRLVIDDAAGRPRVYEYFGFEDGLAGVGARPSAEQLAGDARRALIDSKHWLLQRGSYLVLRKLEQDVVGFRSWARKNPLLATQMMGRGYHGKPLGAVDFSDDEEGKRCPFHSHVRRANPRTEPSRMREMVRRGMSYLDDEGRRGLMFLAYNRDPIDQFEFVQRHWIARGDSVGGFREDVDPIVGRATAAARFDFHQRGKRVSSKLSKKPFVTLRDGAYFFLPSRSALQRLLTPAVREAVQTLPFSRTPSAVCRAFWKDAHADLDDPARSPAYWRGLQPAVQAREHAVFVAGAQHARQVLGDDATFSVREFGARMRETTGPFFLGMDPGDPADPRYAAQRAVADDPRVIPMAGARGRAHPDFAQTRDQVRDAGALVLSAMALIDRPLEQRGVAPQHVELDVRRYIAALLGQLTGHFFGVADPIDYKLTQWSSDVSLHVFRECPLPQVTKKARASGADFRAYVAQLVALHRAQKLPAHPVFARLGEVIAGFDRLGAAFANDDEKVDTLIGIVSGALATTASLFSHALATYAKQQPGPTFSLPRRDPGPVLLEGLRREGLSVPERIYRVCTKQTMLAGVAIEPDTLVVVGQGAALRESARTATADDITFFGYGTHRCPAETLALAIIDGAALALAARGPLTRVDSAGHEFSLIPSS